MVKFCIALRNGFASLCAFAEVLELLVVFHSWPLPGLLRALQLTIYSQSDLGEREEKSRPFFPLDAFYA